MTADMDAALVPYRWSAQIEDDIYRDVVMRFAPHLPLNKWFQEIVGEGTGKTFEPEHNRDWTKFTRPIVGAFFHARYFLEMACKYGKELESPPACLPSGWAAVLYLYNLRWANWKSALRLLGAATC